MGTRRPATVLLALLPIVLGASLWRIERTRPLWFRPLLWSVSRPPPIVPSRLPRLVLAFHYPWYGTPTGPTRRWRHWNHPRVALPDHRILGFHDPGREIAPGRLDLGAAHYPGAGPYDSRDPALIRHQMRLAEAAGLDGFIVSWWGRESEEARTFDLLLAAARETRLRLAPYYEVAELWPRGGAGVASDLEALHDRHGRNPGFLRVDGIPVIFAYGAQRLRPGEWEYVRRRLAAGGRHLYLIGDSHRPRWLPFVDALHVYTPIRFLAGGDDLETAYREWAASARAAGVPFMPAVAPGFDDRPIREPATVVDRAAGATYDASWRAALAVEPPWILLASWNEWHEGSEVEPSREHGTRYLEATRRWVEVFRGATR